MQDITQSQSFKHAWKRHMQPVFLLENAHVACLEHYFPLAQGECEKVCAWCLSRLKKHRKEVFYIVTLTTLTQKNITLNFIDKLLFHDDVSVLFFNLKGFLT